MKVKSIISLALLLFTANLIHAENGHGDYVITTAGDTVSAKIKYDIWGHVTYQLYGTTQKQYITNGNIKEFYWSAQKTPLFVAVNLPGDNKNKFVALIERGKINLYELVHRSSRSSTKYWYASKNNGAIVQINNERRLFGTDPALTQNFINLINDDPTLTDDLKSKKFSFKEMRTLIRSYNHSI